jgi:hypothetical protein
MDLRRIASSAKQVTSNRSRALIRAVNSIEVWRRTKRLTSGRNRHFWHIICRICLVIAAPFIFFGIFAAGAVFGWPVMLTIVGVLGAICIWHGRQLLEHPIVKWQPPPNAGMLLKIASFIAQRPLDKYDLAYYAFNAVVGTILLALTLGMVWVAYWLADNLGLGTVFVFALAVVMLCAYIEQRCTPVYMGRDWLTDRMLGHNTQQLPPPAPPQLPPSGTPQIDRASTAIARRSSNTSPTVSHRQGNNSCPGPVARR